MSNAGRTGNRFAGGFFTAVYARTQDDGKNALQRCELRAITNRSSPAR